MTAPWLSIVGLGEDGLDGLPPAARPLFDGAEILMGGARHLAMVPDDGRQKVEWPSPLTAIVDRLKDLRGRRVCILATGDPQWYGIGSTLAREIPADEIRVVPGRSAFSLAASRLGWSLDTVTCLTLHGRPIEALRAALVPGARILALSHDGSTPGAVADLLANAGFGESRMTVFEHLEGEGESCVAARAEDWSHVGADLNTIAIACIGCPKKAWFATVPGLPDDAFIHDGKLTKREIRAATLAKLMPVPGALLWDIGTGCGSVAVEWMRAARNARAIGVDSNPERLGMASENALALGTPGLRLIEAAAPEGLADLPKPDAIFIGGGLSTEVFDAAWAALPSGGRLVANAVTLESETVLADLHARHAGDMARLSVQRAIAVGSYRGWKPLMPVTQWSVIK
ncbi:MAG: precorrin-6y C5,15-methyltransferase (decarboxylating) subunit CbiE [Pseudomonadota bacterium]